MAWFKQTEEEEVKSRPDEAQDLSLSPKKKAGASRKTARTITQALSADDFSYVLVKPRITEKATDSAMHGVYVFDVASNANKRQIASAIRQVYNVVPEKIRVAKVAEKHVRHARSGIEGVKSGGKKAYVYLKEGDSITVM